VYEENLGIAIEEVPLFFNYQSNGDSLAGFIAHNCPPGTKLLYLSHEAWREGFISAGDRLRHRKTLRLDLPNHDMFLRVYEKVESERDLKKRSKHAPIPRQRMRA